VYGIVNNMSSDVDFIADLDRAARALRAATVGALIAGARPEDVARIVAAGIQDAQRFPAVRYSRARSDQLGHRPDGQLPDSDLPPAPTDLGDGHGEPGDWDFRPPSIHPGVGRRRAA
jgi:hypothetical protein